jgi:hypothetical protein
MVLEYAYPASAQINSSVVALAGLQNQSSESGAAAENVASRHSAFEQTFFSDESD